MKPCPSKGMYELQVITRLLHSAHWKYSRQGVQIMLSLINLAERQHNREFHLGQSDTTEYGYGLCNKYVHLFA